MNAVRAQGAPAPFDTLRALMRVAKNHGGPKLQDHARLLEADIKELVTCAQAAGVMPHGYCFCPANYIGVDGAHVPECRDLQTALSRWEPKP